MTRFITKLILPVFSIIILFNLNCLGPQKPLPEYSREVAKVDNLVIEEDLLRFKIRLEMNKLPEGLFDNTNPDYLKTNPDFQALLQDTFNKMLNDYITIAYGEKKGITIDKNELAQKLVERKKHINAKIFDNLLLEKKIPYSRWKQLIETEIKVQFVLDKELSSLINISSQDIRSYYYKNKNDFIIPERVRVRHLVTDSLEKARDLHSRLSKGENFAKIAVNHSLSPDRAQGGDLGFFAKGNFPKEFDETCFSLKKGEISPIVKSDYGYHIFKLLDRQPPGRTSLIEASSQIYQKLFEEKLNKKYEEWIALAKSKVTIVINQNVLDSFFL